MEDKIIQLIADQLNIKPEEIKPEQEFIKDLKADSLDIVELVMNMEDHFNLQIPDEEAEKLVTVKDAVKYIATHAKTNEATAATADKTPDEKKSAAGGGLNSPGQGEDDTAVET